MQSAKIKILTRATTVDVKDVNRLLSQLSLSNTPPRPLTYGQFTSLLKQKNVFFLVIMSSLGAKGRIIGFIIIYLVRIPSGLLAVAEDLIIDKPYRKWGVGRILMEHAIDLAEKKGARHISLRTNPQRIEANKLYEQMGFHLMPTNFFRINLPRKK